MDNLNIGQFNKKIKSIMHAKGVGYVELLELLKTKYHVAGTFQNLAKKIKNGTIKHLELVQILDVLGYDVEFIERK